MSKPAARVSDSHVCPMVDPGPKPHVGGPVLPPGEPSVASMDGYLVSNRIPSGHHHCVGTDTE